MNLILASLILFMIGYVLNMFYISVLYHRGLAHKSIIMGKRMYAFLGLTGAWMTGLDPKTWACMHRLHHMHADTPEDPHSPTQLGLMGVWIGQYKSYLKIEEGLSRNDKHYSSLVADIAFDISFCHRYKLTWLPYLLHFLIAVVISYSFSSSIPGIAYFVGIMGHPIQGWMVNALAHKYGSRNFETNDDSTNNTLVGIFVFGEGYQNNHHQFPKSAKFSVKWNEIDTGYLFCLLGEKLGFFQIPRNQTNASSPY